MGIFSKFKNKKKGDREYYLSLDIGTEVVKALIFYIDKSEKKGIVIGSGRCEQKGGNMQSGAISDISGVVLACKNAIEESQSMANVGPVTKVVMGIAGELVKGTTTTVHYERAKSEDRIDLAELKEIIQKVQEKAYERITKQIAWELGRDVEVRLINAAIVDVRIDGYRITNPLNFQGKRVSISIFNAHAPTLHLGAIDTIAKDLDLDIMNVVAEPYAVSSSVGYEDILDFSAIFIDIGGGTTDVAVVRNGGLEGTKMFAIGGIAFTKRLAHDFRITIQEAEKLKVEYSHGKVADELNKKIREIILEDAAVWLSGVELSLAEFAENDLLPPQIYICGGGSALPELQEALLSNKWVQNLPFANLPRVSFLKPRDVVRMIDATKTLDSPQDVTPLALASLMVDIQDEERILVQILRRTMRSI